MAVEEISSGKDVSLRDMQISAILKMLFLNKDSNNNDNITTITDDIFNQQEIIWKVLVLDVKSTATISSVLRVNDLLKAGITVHSLIKQDRSPLPDVPAIYFVSPTKENIDVIVNDLKNDKYSEFYINFTSSLPRNLLEDLAQQVAIAGKSDKIKQSTTNTWTSLSLNQNCFP